LPSGQDLSGHKVLDLTVAFVTADRRSAALRPPLRLRAAVDHPVSWLLSEAIRHAQGTGHSGGDSDDLDVLLLRLPPNVSPLDLAGDLGDTLRSGDLLEAVCCLRPGNAPYTSSSSSTSSAAAARRLRAGGGSSVVRELKAGDRVQVRDEDEPEGWEWGTVEGLAPGTRKPIVCKDGWDEAFEWFAWRAGDPGFDPGRRQHQHQHQRLQASSAPPQHQAAGSVVVRVVVAREAVEPPSGSDGEDSEAEAEEAAWCEVGFEVACDGTLPVSLLLSDVLRKCGGGERVSVGGLERLPASGDEYDGGVPLDLEDEVGAVLRTGDTVRAVPYTL